MNEETRAVAVQFLFSENLFRIFGIGFLPALFTTIHRPMGLTTEYSTRGSVERGRVYQPLTGTAV